MLRESQGSGEDRAVAWQASPNRPGRRNSFTSMYDVTADIEQRYKRRSLPRASASHVQVEKSPFHEGLRSERVERGPSHRRSYSSQDYLSPHSEPVGRHRLSRHGEEPQNPIESSLRKYDSPKPGTNRYHFYTDTEESESLADEVIQSPGADALPIIAISQTQLVRDSSAFDQGRIRILAKKYFRKWFIHAHEHIDKFLKFEPGAAQRDRLMLQRQAFDLWLEAHRRFQRDERVRQLSNALERHAEDKHDRSLKAKTISHWYNFSLENRATTEAARQKHLSVKYFTAWHRLTVTNELKAERQSLKVPLHKLRKRAAQYYQDEIKSLEQYYSNLTKMIFWRWAFAYADRKAPRTRDTALAKRAFFLWRAKLKDRYEQGLEAMALYEQNVLRRSFRLWLTQTRIDFAGDHQADAFRMQSLTKRVLVQWRLVTQLAPVERRVTRMRHWRIARSNFGVWLLRARMVFSADWVNTLRTEQNAFSSWNERLRRDAVQARTDNRILAQAMYKWVVAQRAILMIRIRQEREKRSALIKLLTGFRKHREGLQTKEAQLKNQRFAVLARSTLECWKLQMNLTKERSQMAVEFYTPKVQQDMLTAWRERQAYVQKLENWATDASFYFNTMKTLKRWRDAASEARKKRTNDAYKKVRRQIKMNLARKVLLRWQTRVDEIKAMSDRRQGMCQSKDDALLRSLLSHWHDRKLQRQETMSNASARHEGRIMAHNLHAWIDALRQTINLQIRADQFYHIHLSELCSANLRRVSMKAFGIRRRQQDADAMRGRHWSKHIRNILKHWATHSKDASYQSLVRGSSEPTDAGYGTASQDDPPITGPGTIGPGGPSATQRAEGWTAFDEDLFENDDWPPPTDEHERPQATLVQMPTPGYLNTPSKRAARAKALAKMSTTPATPQSTPFATRLSAGLTNSPVPGAATLTTRKDGHGPSALRRIVQTVQGDHGDSVYQES